MRQCLFALYCFVVTTPFAVAAEDWPMWRMDAGRTGVTSVALADSLKLQWVRDLPEITPAFHSPRLQFDAGYEPIVAKGNVLLASSRSDSVTSYDAKTGEQRWKYRTNGPVRFAPAVWENSVCFGSDDGHMYCVDLQSGTLRWKLRAVPSDRRVLGNRRLISTWPVRGGPVVADGLVYFAAGVWPFEGVFVYAVEAGSGNVVWRNDQLGYLFGRQPHNTEAIGGLAPQGYLVVNNDELIVPCSTAYPARLDRKTGKLIEFELPTPGRFPGGWFAAIDPAIAKALRRGQLTFDDVVNRQRHEDKVYKGHGDSGVSRRIVAAERTLNFDDGFERVEGTIHSMAVADGRLFVTNRKGQIYCFAESETEKQTEVKRWPIEHRKLTLTDDAAQQGKSLLAKIENSFGFALVIGLDNGSIVKSLLEQSEFYVIAFDDNLERVERLRNELELAGLDGTRAAVIQTDLQSLKLPPYIANFITTESPNRIVESWKSFLPSLRPFGGIAALRIARNAIDDESLQDTPETFERFAIDGQLAIRRVGALPGATDYVGGWTPNADELVRFPLGLLWFDDTLAHFKRSPQPQIVGGVMISRPKDWHAPRKEGDNSVDYPLLPSVLSDIYTGRVLNSAEQTTLRAELPETDAEKREPNQYRPPRQKNAWSPEPPVAGERSNPMTGETEPRTFPKTYGCDGGVDYGSFYTVRSGTPAFYDKTVESGTVFLSGPRSGCTNSIIPAGGLLNVPYFYEGCTCSYPLPTAMSLVAMPESHEQWSSWGATEVKSNSVQRIGLNFGAPGDRISRAGTLWLDFPSVGGPSPLIRTTQIPESPEFRYRHSLWMQNDDVHGWVAASTVEGLRQLTLHDLRPGDYTVRLLFAEPDDIESGSRVQNISMQGSVVLSNFDIRAASGGVMRGVVREIKSVRVEDGSLTLALTALKGKTLISGLEIIRQE